MNTACSVKSGFIFLFRNEMRIVGNLMGRKRIFKQNVGMSPDHVCRVQVTTTHLSKPSTLHAMDSSRGILVTLSGWENTFS